MITKAFESGQHDEAAAADVEAVAFSGGEPWNSFTSPWVNGVLKRRPSAVVNV